jgi:hypothetical protein
MNKPLVVTRITQNKREEKCPKQSKSKIPPKNTGMKKQLAFLYTRAIL